MGWTTPKTWASGYVVLAADLNTHLRDNLLAIDGRFDISASLTDGGVLVGGGSGIIRALAVLADGSVHVGDGTTDPAVLAAFTSSSGTLKHESGGLEANVASFDGYPLIDGGSTRNLKMSFDETDPPDANDDTTNGWSVGSLWGDVTNDKFYICLDITDGAAVWTDITRDVGATQTTIVNGTRTASAGSGTQAVTGAGFAPTGVLAVGVVASSDFVSWGFGDDADAHVNLRNEGSGVFAISDSEMLNLKNGSNTMKGDLTSLDADGCTIEWVKTSSGVNVTWILYFFR